MGFIKTIILVVYILFIAVPLQAEIYLYDADGLEIGIVIQTGGTSTEGKPIIIYVTHIDKFITLNSFTGDLFSAGSYYYKSVDCTGQPYLSTLLQLNHVYRDRLGNPVYIDKSAWPGTSVVINSYMSKECWSSTGNSTLYEPTIFNEEDLPFSLPIKMPYYFKFKPNTRTIIIPMN